ncbi:MAG: hypothetical protein WA510_10635 [Acidobacteriaceae bacterium]
MNASHRPHSDEKDFMLSLAAEIEKKRLSGLVAEEAMHFPECETEHYLDDNLHRSSWKIFKSGKNGKNLKGMLNLSAREATLPEKELRELINREIWRILLLVGDRAYHYRELHPAVIKGWVQVVERAGFKLVVRFEDTGIVRQADLWDLHPAEHPGGIS